MPGEELPDEFVEDDWNPDTGVSYLGDPNEEASDGDSE